MCSTVKCRSKRVVLPTVVLLAVGCGGSTEPAFDPLVIGAVILPPAVPTVAYSVTLQATGGDGTYTWAVSAGSPPGGLALSTSGEISGTPTGAGSTFTVQVASGDGQTASQELTLEVNDVLTVTTTSLANPVNGIAYSVILAAAGGAGSMTWSLTGSLPAGLVLNSTTGEISGTPTVVETENFTVGVASADGQTAMQALSLSVDQLTLSPTDLCTDYPGTVIATFDDSNLEAAVRAELGLGASDDLTCDLVASVSALDARSTGTVSLVGAQNLTGVTDLDLRSNPLSDLDPLAGLTALTRLVLWADVNITDIGPLSGLTNLTELIFSSSPISDISPLAGLTSLTRLDLRAAQISDLTPLAGLTALTELRIDIQAPGLSDLSPLSGLTNLTTVWLSANQISDITALGTLTNLGTLLLSENDITDLSPLSGLTSLWLLDLSGNPSLNNLSPLSGLSGLNHLRLNGDAITDISPLSSLSSLSSVDLDDNSISDVSGLGGLTSLASINIQGNMISDLGPLSGLTALTSLDVQGNSVTDISPLATLTALTFLALSGNSISDIGPLGSLTSLDRLFLGTNPIIDLDPLSTLTALTFIHATGASLTDISGLSGLTGLTTVFLDYNAGLADIQPLIANPGMGAGDLISIAGTAVSCADVASLQATGASVLSDCP